MDSMDFFSGNMALHEEQDQLKRQKSALKLNVQSIDPSAQEGVINDYHVSLIYCPCRDFAVRGKPCKHIYRLAHELGVFQLSGQLVNDPSLKSRADIEEEKQLLMKEIAALSSDEQTFLRSVLYEYQYGDKRPLACHRKDVPTSLIEKGLLAITDVPDMRSMAIAIPKKKTSAFVKEHGCDIKRNLKNQEILNQLYEKYPDLFAELSEDILLVLPSEHVLVAPRKAYSLLVDTTKDDEEYECSFTFGLGDK